MPPSPPHRDSGLPPRTPRLLHLDVDAFLASVEQAVHPELAGLPVVVGGMPEERNLVMSCSYPARAFGVRPGMLLAEAARLCPRAIFRRGDSQAANRMREAVAAILLRATPKVEIASIDDFFADLTGTVRLQGAACEVADSIRTAIRRELSLPVTIGIATNKTLARVAGKLAKPGGIAEILPGKEADFLSAMPIEHLPGAGQSTGAQLARMGIRTCGDLALLPREALFAAYGAGGLVLHARARGIDRDPVEPTYVAGPEGTLRPRIPRSIRRDSTFEPEEGRREVVLAMLAYLVERAAHRLRAHGAAARALAVRIVYVDTRPVDLRRVAAASSASAERRRKLAAPSDSTDELLRHARVLFRELPRRRALVKTVGITLVDLAARAGWQNHLFGEPADEAGSSREDRHRRLDRALDRLREKHGFGRVLRGASFPLVETHPLGPDGFQLRTPSLNQ
ncbi:MAG TPA: DNA polymerase IV [Myxococcota bacterium]|nr:DNA polymerase IV [Myxococcota bacterium]